MSKIVHNSQLRGTIVIPPSKSMAHRSIICASLAQGNSIVRNVAYNQDILATIGAMKKLGARIDCVGDVLYIEGIEKGINKDINIDCKESGSTLRFIVPIALACNDGINHFEGQGKLGQRPMNIYYEMMEKDNIYYLDNSLNNPNNFLDLTIKGQWKSTIFSLRGDVSSQFVTGLMYASVLMNKNIDIVITTPLQSQSYIDLTIKAMADFGVVVKNDNYQKFSIAKGQKFEARDCVVEGDYSQSAFFYVANLLGANIDIKGLDKLSLQGDRVIVEMCKKLQENPEKDLVFDGQDCPDIIPVFALACAVRKGKTQINNLERLKIKECDRLDATAQELNNLGANIRVVNNSLDIIGVESLKGGNVSSHNDHRMAMMLAIASLVTKDEIIIDNGDCVSKSYPNFWEEFSNLGGKIQ